MADLDMDGVAIKKVLNENGQSYYRHLFIENIIQRITKATARAMRNIFCFPSVASFYLLQRCFPNHGIYIHMASYALWVIKDGRRQIASILKALYLWVAGFDSGSKAIFQFAWVGFPFLAFTATCTTCYIFIAESQSFSRYETVLSFLLYEKAGTGNFSNPLAAKIIEYICLGIRKEIQNPPFIWPAAEVTLLCVLGLLDSMICSRESILRFFKLFNQRRGMRIRLGKLPLQVPVGIPSYEYTGVQRNEIRLLRLMCFEGGYPRVRFSLKMINLYQNPVPNYVALSYVCGPNENPLAGWLEVDGSLLRVSSRVYELLHERAPGWRLDQPAYIWIDSICINQHDVNEKSIQIGMMKDIFSKATSVIAYLRPENHDQQDVAIHFLQNLSRDHHQQRRRKYGLTPWLLGQNFTILDGFLSSFTKRGPSPGWNALTDFFRNEYWKRSWIVQELVLAPLYLRLFYGDHELRWDVLYLFLLDTPHTEYINLTYALQTPGERIDDIFLRISHLFHFRRLRLGGNIPEATDLLWTVRALHATDPRDRVYAFLGFEQDREDKIIADYHRPIGDPRGIESVYEAIARRFLERDDPEWLLTAAGIGYSTIVPHGQHDHGLFHEEQLKLNYFWTGVQLDLPSWVPDLQSPHPIPLPNMRNRAANRNEGNIKQIAGSILIDDKTNELEIRTVFIDSVLEIVTQDLFPMQRGVFQEFDMLGNLRRTLHILDVLRALNQKFVSRPEESVDASFYMTVTVGTGAHLLGNFEQYLHASRIEEPRRRLLLENPLSNPSALFRTPRAFPSHLSLWEPPTNVCHLREVAISDHGYMVLVPRLTLMGDCIHRLEGSETLLVLRRFNSERSYQLIGQCYIHKYAQFKDEGRSSSRIRVK